MPFDVYFFFTNQNSSKQGQHLNKHLGLRAMHSGKKWTNHSFELVLFSKQIEPVHPVRLNRLKLFTSGISSYSMNEVLSQNVFNIQTKWSNVVIKPFFILYFIFCNESFWINSSCNGSGVNITLNWSQQFLSQQYQSKCKTDDNKHNINY